MHKYFLGIDLGTGSAKGVAMDTEGITICKAQHYYVTSSLQPGYSEQNPALVWEAFLKCVKEITAALKSPPLAISLSSAMHSIIPVDKNGNALADAMLWADSRSGDIAQTIRGSAEGEDIYRHTGTAIYAMSPLCKLIWLRENNQQLFNKAHKFISIKEYVWHKLFGVYEIDYSIASATGLFDILALKWHKRSLDMAGINSTKLSRPVNTDHNRSLTKVSELLPGITKETRFVIGASDGCCANLGGGAVVNGIAALTIGTSGAVRVGSDTPVYNYKAMTFNYLLNEKTFICGGAVNNGGAAVDWLLKSFLKLGDISGETYGQLFSDIASVKPGSEGLIFLPYLYAERAPVWDAKSSGAFLNINFKHQRQHFLRAVLEGICFALYDVMNAVEDPSHVIKEVVISGGFLSSPVWVQLLADVTGKKLVIQQSEDASAIGAIFLAMKSLSIDSTQIVAKEAAGRAEIMPVMDDHKVYSEIFTIYKRLYSDLRSSMHLMHTLNN